jgi:hypothetical protein
MSRCLLLLLIPQLILVSWQCLPSQQAMLILQQESPPLQNNISGSVLTSQEKPVPGVLVVLESIPSKKRYRTTTSIEGIYVFHDIHVGRYLIKVYSKQGVVIVREIDHYPHWRDKPIPGDTGEYVWPNSRVHLRLDDEATPTPTPTPSTSPSANPTQSTPTPTATPLFTPSSSPTTTPPTSKIDQILTSMDFGNIAFNVPTSMSLQKAETITLLLNLKQTTEELAQQLKNEGATGDIQKPPSIKVHDKMQAVISGDGFQIMPWTPDILPVSKQETTQWRWDVRAQRAGTLKLHVVLNAIVDLDDGSGPRPYPIKTFDRTYVVEVPWQDGALANFFKNNYQWLWTTLIIPVGAWLWNRKRKKGAAGFILPKPRR